jgi:hypothetical protein
MFHRSIPERPITTAEAAVLGWLLENAPVGDVSAYREVQLEELRVVGGCDCGCSSLDFVPDAFGETMIADAIAKYRDGQMVNLILWGCKGKIQWLEVVEMHPVADRFPELADLRTYEQWGAERLK